MRNKLLNSIRSQTTVDTGADPATAKGLYEKYRNFYLHFRNQVVIFIIERRCKNEGNIKSSQDK